MIRSPYLKAIAPAALTVLAVLIQSLSTTNGFSKQELITAIVGLGASALTLATANLSSGVSAYLKALNPALMTAVVVGVTWAATGEFNRAEIVAALTGGLAALTSLLLPNVPATTARR